MDCRVKPRNDEARRKFAEKYREHGGVQDGRRA
jgi:hypothetical protein